VAAARAHRDEPPATTAEVRARTGSTAVPVDPAPASGHPGVAATGPSDPESMMAALRRGWPQVVAVVARNPANRPVIAACRPVEVRDGIVVLGVPEDQAFMRDIAERKRAALEEGLAAVLGRAVGVRCVVANLELAEPGELADDASSPDEDLVAHARRIFEGDVVDVGDIS
jgi:hypothetical protein